MTTEEGRGPSPNDPKGTDQLPLASLSPMEAERAREDALRRAGDSWANTVTAGHHGRVEEETRLLTERMAQDERRRRREAAARLDAPPASTAAHVQSEEPERANGLRLPAAAPVTRILTSLDGSLFSERALPYAEALSRATGAELVLAYSTDRSDLARLAGLNPAYAPSEPAAAMLERARARIASGGLRVQARIVYGPDPASGVIKLASEVGAEVIALATHAREGMDLALLGSVARDVVRASHRYTLITPPGSPDMRDRRITFSRILLPLDGSALAESALGMAVTLLSRTTPGERPRRLTLLYVAESHVQERDGATYLREIQAELERQSGARGAVFTKVVLGSAPVAIVAEAGGTRAPIPSVARYDLALMSTHGRGGIGEWFYGSVASYALSHGDTCLLLARSTTRD